jgi:RNA polymerase sigma-70 factor (ECF subfamily)
MGDTSDMDAVLDAVARGDREAFRAVVRAYGLPLRAYLASQVHHRDDVDDLAQETLLASLHGLSGFRRGEDFGAWLRGIARHKLQNHFRGAARRGDALDRFRGEVARSVESELEADAAAARADRIEALLRCISRLPERLRQVVRSGLEGGKPAELAASLETSVGAVYTLHYRANRLLRDCVAKEAP